MRVKKFLNAFECGIFPKRKQGKGLRSILDHIAKIVRSSKY